MILVYANQQFTGKPWGYERILAQTDEYVVKLLHIKAGCRLSRQYHKVKDETLWLISGESYIDIGVRVNMERGISMRIRPFLIHRICAVTDSEYIEVSTPELNDIVRLEDDYGRVKPCHTRLKEAQSIT